MLNGVELGLRCVECVVLPVVDHVCDLLDLRTNRLLGLVHHLQWSWSVQETRERPPLCFYPLCLRWFFDFYLFRGDTSCLASTIFLFISFLSSSRCFSLSSFPLVSSDVTQLCERSKEVGRAVRKRRGSAKSMPSSFDTTGRVHRCVTDPQ